MFKISLAHCPRKSGSTNYTAGATDQGDANIVVYTALVLFTVGMLTLGYIVPLSVYRDMYLSLVVTIMVGIVVYHFMHGWKVEEKARSVGADWRMFHSKFFRVKCMKVESM